MRILIDAMGGDNAPNAIVQGAIDAAKEFHEQIVLVGRGEAILNSLKELGQDTLPEGVEIANADDVVDMHDDPATVIKTRKDSSMIVGLRMLADGEGDAFVSAGSTGALISAATLIVKRVKGVRRAAFCPELPLGSRPLLIDCGANSECTPEFLLQFAYVGTAYAEQVQGKTNPSVGLLNIGVEDTKGTTVHKEAYVLLKKAHEQGLINFVGNVEAREVPEGVVDVVVADGFSCNVLLKAIEGTASAMNKMIKQMFMKNLATKIGALLCKGGIKDLKKRLDYREVGGTMLLGISKPVIKAHGSSDARAIRSTVRQAIEAARSDITPTLQAALPQLAKMTKE